MLSHLSMLGFSADFFGVPGAMTTTNLRALLLNEAVTIESLPVSGGYYVRCGIGAGIELWLAMNEDRQIAGIYPHYVGTSQVRAAITHFYDDPIYPLAGSLHAWTDPQTDDPESGGTRIVCEMPGAAAIRATVTLPALVTLQITAFAHEFTLYPDDDAFHASQQGEVKFAVESFVPVGLFDFSSTPNADAPSALARFVGHVEHTTLLTNPASGLSFHVMRVRTFGGTFDVVVHPTMISVEPRIGGVVEGTFWLTGRVRSDEEDTTVSQDD